jgi:predicted DNA-binding transcriptional regulator AlpA
MDTNTASADNVASPLSPEGLMRRREVLALVMVHPITLWRMERRGDFPRHVQITKKSIGWRRRDVMNWIASLK